MQALAVLCPANVVSWLLELSQCSTFVRRPTLL